MFLNLCAFFARVHVHRSTCCFRAARRRATPEGRETIIYLQNTLNAGSVNFVFS